MTPTLNFSREEFAARLDKTRAAMAAAGIDLLIVTDPSNMHWLTGYDGWSFYVHQCVLVPPDGEPVWYLVPDGVVQYINKHHLYAGGPGSASGAP